MSNSGIYKIQNLENGKLYIGQALDLDNRFYQHKWDLQNNKHKNKHLQRAWNLYGEICFKFEIIETTIPDAEFLYQRELYYYNLYNKEQLYNMQIPAKGSLGREFTEESKQKISNSLKGRKATNDHIKRMQEQWRGEGNPRFGVENQVKQVCMKTGEVIEIYHNPTIASRSTGIRLSYICKACNGNQKSAGGYFWEYV